ncbi:MAG: hypothetical protein HYY30_08985 [Chloroflexi bacterium]|nr:hypothetical protein [Chloroflexota bacterium]
MFGRSGLGDGFGRRGDRCGFGIGSTGAELGQEIAKDLAVDRVDIALLVGALPGMRRVGLGSLRTAPADGRGEGIVGTPELALDGGLVPVELFEDVKIGEVLPRRTGVQARVIAVRTAQQDGLGAGDVAGFGAGDILLRKDHVLIAMSSTQACSKGPSGW